MVCFMSNVPPLNLGRTPAFADDSSVIWSRFSNWRKEFSLGLSDLIAEKALPVISAGLITALTGSVADNTVTGIEPAKTTVLFESGEMPVKLLEWFLYAECAVEAESMRLFERGRDKKCNRRGGGY